MGRFSLNDASHKRRAPDTRGTGFLNNITGPKTSASTFLAPRAQASQIGAPFAFTFGSGLALVQHSTPRAWAHESRGGSSAILSGIEAGMDAQKLAAAFQTPFHGVAIDDAQGSPPEEHEDLNEAVAAPTAEEPTKPSFTEKIKSLLKKVPLLSWRDDWSQLFLHEAIRHDGRAEALGLTKCPGCKKDGFPEYRCEDCRYANYCKECTLFWHRHVPLHNLERWNASEFYERVSGAEVGIRIQLLHPPGEVCKFRSLHSVEKFTIIHTNGIHKIPVDFCKCEIGKDIPYHIQLMRWRLWPATCEDPHTATTFEALDCFTRLSAFGRLNVYDFYRALEASTNGAMLQRVANVRQQLSNCVRQFRHIMMFKRAGRGHEPGGIAGTPPGACAVRCPACPDLKLNMKTCVLGPLKWIGRAFLGVDANFRLSNKFTYATKQTDPSLTDGRAYMAPWKDYAKHIRATNKELSEKSTCSKFSALELANVREVTISYDIACQYCRKIKERLARIPHTSAVWAGAQTFAALVASNSITYAVPKFHLFAHKLWCQLRFAFGWLFGTAITDGEAVERLWSAFNAAASSLREMGPGGNNDTLDDMFGAWNWMKTCCIGASIAQINSETEKEIGSATNEVARGLAKEDAVLAECLLDGLRIEDERARITARHDSEGETDKQATTKTTVLKGLALTITNFRAVQEYAMPATYARLSPNERDPAHKTAMTVALGLPSAPLDGDTSLVSAAAKTMEAKYRWALMKDELDRLLHQLRWKGCLHKHRIAHVTGQRASTRSLSAQAAVSANVKRAADAYRRHRAAYEVLVGDGSWKDVMRELKDSECRPLGDRLIEQMEKMAERKIKKFLEGKSVADTSGETNYKLPWIWYSWGGKTGAEITDQLITEWAKSRARSQHWVQEIQLVDAEMQRAIEFSESMALIWDARRNYEKTIDIGPEQSWACDDAWADGMRAYASKQAFIRRAHAAKWTQEFAQLRMEAKRFLTVHTDDGLSLEPLTLLSVSEVEDMRLRARLRRERRNKPKRVKPDDEDPDVEVDDGLLDLFEEDTALQEELDALASGFKGTIHAVDGGAKGKKPKESRGGGKNRRKGGK
ncbi:unnamed protein product [Peniophora sp. CBMAI 1063]|nr:unnamed protein product [Peniophora sp. CBMAI 1063]